MKVLYHLLNVPSHLHFQGFQINTQNMLNEKVHWQEIKYVNGKWLLHKINSEEEEELIDD